MGIIVVASGGQGGSYLIKRLKAHKRPDIVFCKEYLRLNTNFIGKMTDKPTKYQQKYFLERTRGWYALDLTKTIEKNIVDYLDEINSSETKSTVLAGSLSYMGPFFKSNNIKNVLCLIRHPMHIMISLLVMRHPKHTEQFGGINAEECVKAYALRWNLIAKDAIEGNIKIVRHEYVEEDTESIENDGVKKILRGLYSSERHHGILEPKYEEQLEALVADNYYKVYDRWDI